MELRPYQQKARERVHEEIAKGNNPLLIMATGTGKTHAFSHVEKDYIDKGERVLTLAHLDPLISQAARKIHDITGIIPHIEQSKEWADTRHNLVVASVPTLRGDRLSRFSKDNFGLIVTDEAHHGPSKSYQSIYNHFTAPRLGVTATADRADRKSLGHIYDSVAFEYTMADAIEDGWLAPIKGKRVTDFDIDLSGLRISHGDYQDGQLEGLIKDYVAPISNAVLRETASKKTLLFLPTVAASELMAEALRSLGINAAAISGKDSKEEQRRKRLAFKMGRISHLVSCNLLLEGYDEPSIEAIVMLRPTTSRALYTQAVGRGVRLHPGKDHLLLVEFTYNSAHHKLVQPFDLMARKGFEERVRDRAARSYGETPIDILEALRTASHAAHDFETLVRESVKRDFGWVEFDPIAISEACGVDLNDEFILQDDRKATLRQQELLGRYGVGSENLTIRQASKMIDVFFKNGWKPYKGPATPAQMFFLKKRGIDATGMTKAQASVLIDTLKHGRPARVESLS